MRYGLSADRRRVATQASRVQPPSRRPSAERLFYIWSLPLALMLQAVLSLSLRNTAFQDEALYLYVGRRIFDQLLGAPAPSGGQGVYFSGSPYIYPPLAGALDACCGLEAARLLSLFWILCATGAVYELAKGLYGRDSGLLAAALFAVQGSVLFTGHLATYDAMSVAWLALAAVLAQRAGRRATPWMSLGAGIALTLAVLTKYAAVIFAPTVLCLLAWEAMRTHGWQRALPRVTLAGGILLGGVVLAVALSPGVMIGFTYNTLARGIAIEMSRLLLFQHAAALSGGLLVLGTVGLLLSGRARLPLSLVMLGSGLLAPTVHIYRMEYVSLHKHIAFGLVFVAPLAGFAVTKLGSFRDDVTGRRKLAVLAIALVLALAPGILQAQQLYHDWPDSTAMVEALRKQVRPGDRILAEEMDVPRYYLRDEAPGVQWSDLYKFEYADRAGNQLNGVRAFKSAITDGHFDLVVLRYGPNVDTARAIDDGLRSGGRYDLVAKVPNETRFGPGYYWVWRKRGA